MASKVRKKTLLLDTIITLITFVYGYLVRIRFVRLDNAILFDTDDTLCIYDRPGDSATEAGVTKSTYVVTTQS